ncbi:MAG: PRC-barrel domain-containing protein [Cypionkella sp.]
MRNLMLGTAMAALLAGTMAGSVSAQDMFRTDVAPTMITASEFMGKRVYAADAAVDATEANGVQDTWKAIGTVSDVIMTRDGKVDSVVIDVGGFLGIGARPVALGMENVHFVSDSSTADDPNDYFLVVNAARDLLESAPEYKRTSAVTADNMTAADATATNGAAATAGGADMTMAPAADTTGTAGAMADTAGTTDPTMAPAADESAAITANTAGATADPTTAPAADTTAATGAMADTAGATDPTMAPAVDTTGTAGATATADATAPATPPADTTTTNEAAAAAPTTNGALVDGTMAVDGFAAVDAAGLTSEQLVGVHVYGAKDEDLGKISDLVLGDQGKVTQVIVNVGGFLGIGDKPVAIDMASLQIMQSTDGNELRAYAPMTEDQLKALPAFSK